MFNNKSTPHIYVKNSRVTEIVDNYVEIFHGNSNKVAPLPNDYMCTGNKFVPISTNMSTLYLKNDYKKTDNINKESRTDSTTLLPRLLPPSSVNKLNNRNDKNDQLKPTKFNISKNNNFEKQNSMMTKEMPEIRKPLQNSQTRSVFFTGTIERLLRWNRNLQDIFCLYETVAPVISLQEGRIMHQKIMLLRDRKGPILQVQFFSTTHMNINDFYIGQYLRCVGRMTGMNILSAESIREAKEEEILNLSRLSYVCDYSVNQNMTRQ